MKHILERLNDLIAEKLRQPTSQEAKTDVEKETNNNIFGSYATAKRSRSWTKWRRSWRPRHRLHQRSSVDETENVQEDTTCDPDKVNKTEKIIYNFNRYLNLVMIIEKRREKQMFRLRCRCSVTDTARLTVRYQMLKVRRRLGQAKDEPVTCAMCKKAQHAS